MHLFVFSMKRYTENLLFSITLDTSRGIHDHHHFCTGFTYKVCLADFIWIATDHLLCTSCILCLLLHLWIEVVSIQCFIWHLLSFPETIVPNPCLCNRHSFPFLNFIGIFVAAALGADYIFVTVDKWKNARLEDQTASTEEIAAIALPSSASAMFLTTSTTTVAFFATTICPVTPILCFALFCGLLILFNYVLNIFFLSPALCLYDIWLKRGSGNPLVNFGCCSKSIFASRSSEDGEKKMSLIHKVLGGLYEIIHRFRYVVLVACLAATGVCIYVALTVCFQS